MGFTGIMGLHGVSISTEHTEQIYGGHVRLRLFLATLAVFSLGLGYIKSVEPLEVVPAVVQHETMVYPGIAGRGLIGDEASYLGIAKSLANGWGYSWSIGHPTAVRVPGYPLYVAVLFRLFGASVPVALVGNVILVSFLPLLAYSLAKTAFNQRAGLVAVLFCVLNPAIYYIGLTCACSEALFAVLLCTAMLVWMQARKSVDMPDQDVLREQRLNRPLALAVIAGLLYGMASLTRTGYIGLTVLGVIIEALCSHSRSKIRVAGIVCIVSLLALLPWGIRNRVVLGSAIFSSTGDGETLLGCVLAAERGRSDWLNPSETGPQYARIHRMTDGLERDRVAQHVALEELRKISVHALLTVAVKRVLRLWVPLNRIVTDLVSIRANMAVNVFYLGFMLLAAIGFLKSWRDPRIVPFVTAFLYMSVLAAAAWGGTRFRYGVEPVLAGFAGYAFIEFSKSFHATFRRGGIRSKSAASLRAHG